MFIHSCNQQDDNITPNMLPPSRLKPTLQYNQQYVSATSVHQKPSTYNSEQLKTLEIGPETLKMIDQFEENTSVLKKLLKDYTTEDIAEWLGEIGLGDYIAIFGDNHINGRNILEIQESELKEEFEMNSLGHRKIFVKKQAELKRMQNSQVREKIQKVLGHSQKKIKLQEKKQEPQMYNSLYSNHLNSKYEVIEEEEQPSDYSSSNQSKHKYFKEDDFTFNKSQSDEQSDHMGEVVKKTSFVKSHITENMSHITEEAEKVVVGKKLFINQFGSSQAFTTSHCP